MLKCFPLGCYDRYWHHHNAFEQFDIITSIITLIYWGFCDPSLNWLWSAEYGSNVVSLGLQRRKEQLGMGAGSTLISLYAAVSAFSGRHTHTHVIQITSLPCSAYAMRNRTLNSLLCIVFTHAHTHTPSYTLVYSPSVSSLPRISLRDHHPSLCYRQPLGFDHLHLWSPRLPPPLHHLD